MARGYRNYFKKLDTNGDGTGIKIASGDYSAGEAFMYIPGDNVSYSEIARMIIYIEDTNGATGQDYGNIASGLTNGVEVRLIESDGYVQDLTDGTPIKTNAQWSRKCFDDNLIDWGAGNDSVAIRWSFGASGKPLKIYPGEIFMVYCSDDMSGLIDHAFEIQGVEYYKKYA